MGCSLVFGFMYRMALWLLQVTGGSARKPHLEVERKFKLTSSQQQQLPARLSELGFKPAGQVHMVDTFLPAKQAGDMVRVRRETDNGRSQTLLTLKRWTATADGGREREESERKLGILAQWWLLHFGRKAAQGSLLSFSKQRRLFERNLNKLTVVVGLDEVEGLGQYSGPYLEIEILVQLSGNVDAARKQILALAVDLLGKDYRMVEQSYLEMLRLSRNDKAC